MGQKIIIKTLVIFLCVANGALAAGCAKSSCAAEVSVKVDKVNLILKKMSDASDGLESYSSQIEYLFSQPLFESQTLRKGVLYYKKDKDGSRLRIDFETLKQDDEKEQKHIEQYIFNRRWVTHIDHQLKEVKVHQLAEANDPNEAVDVFDLVKENFPLIGFSRPGELKKDFDITPADVNGAKITGFIGLHLKVRSDSAYKDDYTTVDFWIDKKSYLPARIVATNTEGEISQISLLKAKVNKGVKDAVFEVKVPKGFGRPEVIPLKNKKSATK